MSWHPHGTVLATSCDETENDSGKIFLLKYDRNSMHYNSTIIYEVNYCIISSTVKFYPILCVIHFMLGRQFICFSTLALLVSR